MKVRKEIKELATSKAFERFDDSDFRRVLGDAMPKLERSRVGRMRLIGALQARFGERYRSNAAASELLKRFDDEVEHAKKYLRVRGIIRG